MDFQYNDFVLRNKGYVSDELQEKIAKTRVLIAGCGIGSTISEAALRIGFIRQMLADGDTVEVHNINRQAYVAENIGQSKVKALAQNLRRVNPLAEIKEINAWITQDNVTELVKGNDLIFDTVDFLSLSTIVALHDEANQQKKPIISAVSAGWGAVAIYFPPNTTKISHFRKLFGLPDQGPVDDKSYVKHFAVFIERISEHLDKSIVEAMAKALTIMEDGTPCPAPHLSVGSYAVGSLSVTMAARILNGDKVTEAPCMVMSNMSAVCESAGIDLTP